MGKEEICDGFITLIIVGIVFRIWVWISCPVEEEESTVRVGLFVDDLDD